MSLFGNISMLGSALRNYQYGLNVVSNNIANAATPGYSRQTLQLDPLAPIRDGGYQLGTGADVTGVSRVRNIFLDSRIKFEYGELGRSKAKEQALIELAAIFPEIANPASTAGLKGAVDTLVSNWTALAAAPASIAAKTAVRDSLKSVAEMLQLDARKVFDLQVKLDNDVKITIGQINDKLDVILTANKAVKAAGNTRFAPNTLLDLRNRAANELAELIGAHFNILGDGTMSVGFSGGSLVNGTNVYRLSAVASLTDPGRTGVGYAQTSQGLPTDVTKQITGGKLGGLLTARDGEVEKARLDLDRIAYGIISRSNEVNRSHIAGDGTTGHDLFKGHKASDIIINPIVAATPDYVGATRDALAPGDLAKIHMQLKSFIQFSSVQSARFGTIGGAAIDETQPMISEPFGVVPASGQFFISTNGNAIPVTWNSGQSLDEVIRNINSAGAGAFYATFNRATQKMLIVGQTPITYFDASGNFGELMQLGSVVTSSSPINNYPTAQQNSVDQITALNTPQNTLNLFTTPDDNGGTILVDGVAVNWVITDTIGLNILPSITTATTNPPGQIFGDFDPTTQLVTLEKTGDPAFNLGMHATAPGMTAIQILDQTGNLTRSLNLDTNTNGSNILDELVITVGSRKTAENVLKLQAQALVDQTDQLQSAQSSVDLNAEIAQARLYQRSYEASVRLQAIMDEMLNVLINRTGTSSSASGAI